MKMSFIITVTLFFTIAFLISFFVKTKNAETEYKEKNDSAKRIMVYVHNKNSSDGVEKYIESFNKIKGFAPNYIGWK